jgi:hypothetical protein
MADLDRHLTECRGIAAFFASSSAAVGVGAKA